MESMNLVKGYDSLEDPVSSSTRRAAHKRRLTFALSLTLFITLLIFALVSALFHAPTSHPRPQPSSPSSNSLKIVCAVTQHPDSCFESISSLPEPGPKPNPEQYLNLSIQAAVKEVTNSSTLPKLLIPKVNDPGTVSALKDCMSLFDDALSQLNESASELNKVGPTTEMKVNNMQTWISAAMTDQDTCLEGLDEMGSPLIGEVKARVQKATSQVWEALLQWQQIQRQPMGWNEELNWCQQHRRGKGGPATIYRTTLSAAVYYIWQERNQTVFQKRRRRTTEIVRVIVQEVFHLCSHNSKLTRTLNSLNFYPI